MSLFVLQGAVEQGFIYSLVALALYLSFRTLDIARALSVFHFRNRFGILLFYAASHNLLRTRRTRTQRRRRQQAYHHCQRQQTGQRTFPRPACFLSHFHNSPSLCFVSFRFTARIYYIMVIMLYVLNVIWAVTANFL